LIRFGLAIDLLEIERFRNVVVDQDVVTTVIPYEPEAEGAYALKKVMKRQIPRSIQGFSEELLRVHIDLDGIGTAPAQILRWIALR
jgi:hypothetical protein